MHEECAGVLAVCPTLGCGARPVFFETPAPSRVPLAIVDALRGWALAGAVLAALAVVGFARGSMSSVERMTPSTAQTAYQPPLHDSCGNDLTGGFCSACRYTEHGAGTCACWSCVDFERVHGAGYRGQKERLARRRG